LADRPPPARRSPAGRRLSTLGTRRGYWTVAAPIWAAVVAVGVVLHLAGVIKRIDAEGIAVVGAALVGALRYAILMSRV